MKMISDGGQIINICGVKFSRSEDYPRKTWKFTPLEISYPYGKLVRISILEYAGFISKTECWYVVRT